MPCMQTTHRSSSNWYYNAPAARRLDYFEIRRRPVSVFWAAFFLLGFGIGLYLSMKAEWRNVFEPDAAAMDTVYRSVPRR